VFSGAQLILGSGYANYNFRIECYREIRIGEGVIIAHNVFIRDSDSHQLVGNREPTQPIIIGDHVWIGLNSVVLKGVTIGSGSVIAAGSVVTRSIPEKCLAAGNPAKVIRENINWKV
jgi:acetyltransferase-like isoleucine patch superfamily enzyme